MELRQVEHFVAVVDHGTFSAAARSCRIAQPSLSQSIASLERGLRTKLFERVGRSVRLTSAGEAFLEPARQILRDTLTARAAVTAVADVAAGHLDIVCLPTLAVSPVSELIGEFRRRHPLVTVRLGEPEDLAAVTARVRTGTAELGITELPVRESGLETFELAAQHFVAVLPRGWAQRRRTGVAVEELAELPLVTTPVGTSTRSLVDSAFSDVGLEPRIAVETDHREAILALVSGGAGYSILPAPVAERVSDPTVQRIPLAGRFTRRVGIVHREGPMSPAARAILDVARSAGPTKPAATSDPRADTVGR